MKNICKTMTLSLVILAGMAVCLHLLGGEAFAEESTGEWRKNYDMVMLWVNFGILAFIIVKFGKNPLMGFLRMRKDEVAAEINDLENEKALLSGKIEEARQALADSDARFSELKETIVHAGEKKRQDKIEEAERESKNMMTIAQQKVGGYIMAAKRAFEDKLIDASVNLAMSRLPDQMTDEDNQRMVDQYLSTVDKEMR